MMSVDFFPKFDKVKILEQNEGFLIINKPSGLLVHPDKYSKEQTLVDILLKAYPKISGVGQLGRDGIVHRLDKDVSGIMVVAKTQKMYDFLIEQFQKNNVKKQYLALVYDQPPENKGTIDLPLARNKKGKIIALIYNKHVKLEKSAITEYEIKERFKKFSLLKICLLTGRTHQIRVHLRSIKCPIVGDQKYKLRDKKLKSPLELNRIFLHSRYLGFYNLQNEWQEFRSELPKKLKEFLKNLRNN